MIFFNSLFSLLPPTLSSEESLRGGCAFAALVLCPRPAAGGEERPPRAPRHLRVPAPEQSAARTPREGERNKKKKK